MDNQKELGIENFKMMNYAIQKAYIDNPDKQFVSYVYLPGHLTIYDDEQLIVSSNNVVFYNVEHTTNTITDEMVLDVNLSCNEVIEEFEDWLKAEIYWRNDCWEYSDPGFGQYGKIVFDKIFDGKSYTI